MKNIILRNIKDALDLSKLIISFLKKTLFDIKSEQNNHRNPTFPIFCRCINEVLHTPPTYDCELNHLKGVLGTYICFGQNITV